VKISGLSATEVGTITVSGTPISAATNNVGSAAFGADGKLYFAVSNGNAAYTLDLATATATALGNTGVGSVDFASCTFPSFAPALKVSKTVSPAGTVTPGDILTYTVEIENTGTGPASGVKFADALPAGTTYVAGSFALNDVNQNAAAYPFASPLPVNGRSAATGALLIGNPARATLIYQVTVNAVSPPTSVSNQGTVTFDGGPAAGVPSDDPTLPGGSDPTVNPVGPAANKPPVPQDLTNTPIPSGSGPTTLTGGLKATDPDGTVATYTVITLPDPAQGVLSLADGSLVRAGQVLTPGQAAGLRFDPAPDFVGDAAFKYTATDDKAAEAVKPATYTIPVGASTKPQARGDSGSTPFNQPITLTPATNDTPGTGKTLDPATIDLDPSTPGQDKTFTVAGEGTYVLNPDGTVTFTPVPGFVGTVSTPYTIKDTSGQTSNPASIAVTVGTPPPPKASDDSATTKQNTPVTLTPPSNDSASAGTSLVPGSIDLDPTTPGQQKTITVAGKGTFDLQPDGTVKFTPVAGFIGSVSTPYTIGDSLGQTSNPANLSVTIPAPPVARNDSATAPYGQGTSLGPVTNDSASPGASLVPGSIDLDPSTPGQQITLSVPGKGTFELQPDGTVKFTPVPGFTGTVSTPYTISDTLGQMSNPANLSVTTPPPPPPTASDDKTQTAIDTPVSLTPISNDSTAPGTTLDPKTIDLDPATPGQQKTVTVANKGTFELQPDGTVKFTPVAGFVGVVTAPYTVQNNLGQTSNPANLTVTVLPLPSAVDDSATTPLNTPVTIPAISNDLPNKGQSIDPKTVDLDPSTPGQQTTFTVAGKGTFDLQPDGTVKFTPVNGFTGAVSTPYTVKDTSGVTTNPATITVTVVGPPRASDDAATTKLNTPVTLNPPANDAASPGTTLVPGSIDLDPATPGQQKTVTVAGKGTFDLQPDGTVKFTPVAGFTGIVTAPYTIGDSSGQRSNPANLSVTIVAPPTAKDDAGSGPYNQPIKLSPPANDLGNPDAPLVPGSIDLDPSTPGQQTGITVPGKGTFTLDPATGEVTFTPVPGFTGTASTPYTISDSLGQTSNPANLTVTIGKPPAPVANPEATTTPLDTPVTLNPPANDAAAPGTTLNPATIDLDPSTPGQQKTITLPGKGTFELQPDGTVKFTPVPGFLGTAEVPYTIADSLGQMSNPASLRVTVFPLPYAANDAANTPLDTPVTLNPVANDTPRPGTPLDPKTIDLDPSTPDQDTKVIVPGQGTFELLPDGTVKFTPVAGFTGTATLPYTVKDNAGNLSNPALIQVTVNPPKAPVATNDAATTPKGTPVPINIPANDVAAPGAKLDPRTIDLDPSTPGQQTSVTVPGEGTFKLDPATGVVTFTPLPDFVGVSTIVYTIRDNYGQLSNPANIAVTVGDGAPAPGTSTILTLEKRALSASVSPGSTLAYELKATNSGSDPLSAVTLSDPLPVGLRYVTASSTLGAASLPDPAITVNAKGQQVLVWTLPGTLASKASLTVRFSTLATAAISGNSLENSATAKANGAGGTVLASNVARVRVRVEAGVFSDAPVILGRVYLDTNADRNFQRGKDVPVRGARVYLSNGRYAVSDKEGRYSFTDLPAGLYALRLDPLTAPYTPESVPDDQGRPGTRYGRTPQGGGLVTEDFPLVAPKADVNKARSTTVTRGPVKLIKTITARPGGYLVTLNITTQEAVTNLNITDPLPAGATRSNLIGASVSADEQAGVLLLPGTTAPGSKTVSYQLNTTLPAASTVTDPNLTWDEVQP
jgi:uncharacterized repeat protein (TIGR01451 family)